MPDFELTHPDGTKYRITAPDMDQAVAALGQVHGSSLKANPNDPAIAYEPGERPLSVFGGDKTPAAEKPADPIAPESNTPSAAESLSRGFTQGATFDFGDRIAALEAASGLPEAPAALGPVNTLYNMGRLGGGMGRKIAEALAPSIFGSSAGEAYNSKLAEEQARNEAARRANPYSYMGGALMGGIATVPFTPQLAPFKGASALKTLGDLAVTGAGYGAASGVGSSPDLTKPADVAGNVAMGAGTGAVLGPVVGGAAQGAGALGGLVARDITARVAPQRVADAMAARQLIADNPGMGAADAARAAQQKMEGALAQPVPQPMTMVDVAGPKTQSLGGVIARDTKEAGSAGTKFFRERHFGADKFDPDAGDSASGRIFDAMHNMFGNKESARVADQLRLQRKTNAQPLYDAAHIQPINYDNPSGQTLKYVLDNQLKNSDKEAANDLLLRRDKSGTQIIWTKNKAGEYELTGVPNTRQWDYIQQALKDKAVKSMKDGQQTNKSSAYFEIRQKVNDALKDNNPLLRKAQEAYAGDSKMLSAIKKGQDFPEMSETQAAHVFNQLGTPGEKEMFRLAAAESLRKKVGDAPLAADMVKRIFNSREQIRKLRVIAPDQKSFLELKAFLDRESGMFESGAQAIANSMTAGRLADDQAAGVQIAMGLKTVLQIGSGYFWGAMHSIASHLSRIPPERRAAVMEELRKTVLNPDPKAVAGFADRISKLAKSQAEKEAIMKAIVMGLPRGAISEYMTQRQGPPQ